jgi:DDB1- and CUL4-associated factor 13
MATSSSFARPQRSGTHRGRLSISNALPVYFSSSSASSTAVQEKYAKKALRSSWWIPLYIPGLRRLRVFFLNPRRIHDFSMTRFGRKRGSLLLCLSISCLIFFAFALAKRFGTHAKQWPTPFTGDPPTLVYRREDLQRIWQWEITSGHYPSQQRSELFIIYIYGRTATQFSFDPVPDQLRLKTAPENPALPSRRISEPPPQSPYATATRGTGAKRIYLDIQSSPENSAYPPRPVPGSVADLDIVMDHCDFSEKKVISTLSLYSCD